MHYFSVGLNIACLLAQSVLQIIFVGRLTDKRPGALHFALYILLILGLEWLAVSLGLKAFLAVGLQIIILCAFSCLALRNRLQTSGAAAILAVYIAQLSFGVVNSAEAVLFPPLVGRPLLYLLVVLASVLSLLFCAFCYRLVIRFLSLAEEKQTPAFILLLLPECFFLFTELYILQNSYGYLQLNLTLKLVGENLALLIWQVLGLAALFCTLYAYQHIRLGFQAQAALNSLEQAARAQKTYINEARLRYEQTRAFRHDVKNHLLVLGGLLRQGDLPAGLDYLQKISANAENLSFPWQTGNAVLDILLAEKLGLAQAEGIKTEVSLLWPQACGIDDFDLCVIFANALDNAINACRWLEGEKAIWIKGERQGSFYMLEFANTCADKPLAPPGTGLANIRTVAEKYRGAVQIEKEGRRFCLNVLLYIDM